MQASSARPLSGAGNQRGVRSKGSPARVLQELVGTERERVAQLLGELEASNSIMLEQQAQMQVLKSRVRTQLIDEEDVQGDEIIYQQEDSGDDLVGDMEGPAAWAPSAHRGANRQRPRSAVVSAHGSKSGATAALVRRRPLSAVPETSVGDARCYPIRALSAGRTRPTSAGGMGRTKGFAK